MLYNTIAIHENDDARRSIKNKSNIANLRFGDVDNITFPPDLSNVLGKKVDIS